MVSLSAPGEHFLSSPLQQQNLWLCLRFPRLPLYALGVRDDQAQRLCAAIESNRVVAATSALQGAGVCSGMTVSHSRMLMPAIECLERKPLREASLLQQLAHWAYRYSPLISPYQHSLLLDIGGCLRLFHGFAALYERISSDLGAFGIEALCGVAGTAKAAYVLSYESSNGLQLALSEKFSLASGLHNLGQASLESLDSLLVSEKVIASLKACGFEDVQDIVDVPTGELGQRFGVALLDYLDRLLGRKPDPQAGVIPPETFYQQYDFAEPVHNLQWIDQCLSDLLQQLCDFLRQRQWHCQSFEWRFYGDKNALLQRLGISLAAKQNSHQVFKQLTDLQMEKITLSHELMRIELSSDHLLPMSLLSDDFFNSNVGHEGALQLIDKLQARLGKKSVFQLQVGSEYLPELRNRRRPVVTDNPPATLPGMIKPVVTGEHLSSQPVWLLPEPKPMVSSDSGQPCEQINRQAKKTPLQLIHGPDRIASHWWCHYQRRDYFIARQRDGRLLWIFFDLNGKRWFLHGFFG